MYENFTVLDLHSVCDTYNRFMSEFLCKRGDESVCGIIADALVRNRNHRISADSDAYYSGYAEKKVADKYTAVAVM